MENTNKINIAKKYAALEDKYRESEIDFSLVNDLLKDIPLLLAEIRSLRTELKTKDSYISQLQEKRNITVDSDEVSYFESKLTKHLIYLHGQLTEDIEHIPNLEDDDPEIIFGSRDNKKQFLSGQKEMIGIIADLFIEDQGLRKKLRDNEVPLPWRDEEMPF